MDIRKLPFRNLVRRPGRSIAMLLLIALLAMTLFGGTMTIMSLRNGLKSLEGRLGADIIVVPATAASKIKVEDLFLTGTTGYYYMKASYLDQIAAIDGVDKITGQLFLASLRADCCSIPIQVIGIDQSTDFVIQPWIQESGGGSLGEYEVYAGTKVNSGVGESIRIYGQNCKVIGKLAATGTGLDTALYCSMETAELLLKAAEEMGHPLKVDSGETGDVVSCVYVKVREDTPIARVTNYINTRIRKTEASQTKKMITGVSDSLSGVARTVTVLIAIIWLLVFVVLFITFTMLSGERKKEFAVLRLIGVSRKGLSRMMLREAFLISLGGGLVGIAMGALLVFSFSGLIEHAIGLPFLMPDLFAILLMAILTLLMVLIIGPVTSARSAWRLSHQDTGTILREGN